MDRRGRAAAGPLARPVRAGGLARLGVLLLGIAAFTSAGPTGGAASALWHPVRAWRAIVAPVRISADRGVVDHGDSVSFGVEAVGRRLATLWLRKPADAVPAEPDHRDPATGPLPAAPEPAAATPAEPAARSVPAEPAP